MLNVTPPDRPCDCVREYAAASGRVRQYPSRSWIPAPVAITSAGERFYFRRETPITQAVAA